MEQSGFGFTNSTKIETMSREELIQKYQIMSDELERFAKENYELRQLKTTDEQLRMVLEEQLGELQQDTYGASSERYKKPEKPKTPNEPKPRVKRPSERYPNIPIREQLITMNPAPNCTACGQMMVDSGMTEDSEQLTVIPKKYEVLRQCRVKYRCNCHGCIQTAAAPPRIIEGSSYSDEMILDVVLSKYCDLIPIGRYVGMSQRGGLIDLPPHSLIELTHAFANFAIGAYNLCKEQVMGARVLNADETPHRMLEGSDKKSWYLWGFSTPDVCFLECHNTRSGDVATDILLGSKCEVLVTDVFSGYDKATRLANQARRMAEQVEIFNANCNAHARRYFFKPRHAYKEALFYLDQYHEVYQLNEDAKGKTTAEVLELRSQMRGRFEAMKKRAMDELPRYPDKNKYRKALNYFLGNYEGLTYFLNHADVPIDNNGGERLLRSHVVGRKTWYGTHSERGAKTAAVIFTLVETCKLSGINPREYFKKLAQDLLAGKNPYTPREFKDLRQS
jgi:transposase